MALTKVSGGVLENGVDVAGIVTATGFDGPFTGGSSKNVNAGTGTFTGLDVNGNGDISGTLTVHQNATFNGNVSIAKTLTYEDVTSIDSVGIITARDGIRVTSGEVGIGTVTPGNLLHIHGANGAASIRLTESAYANMNKQTQIFNSQGNTYIQTRNDSSAGNLIVRGIASSGSTTPEFLRITSAGLVGIGTVTPESGQLQVIGSGYHQINISGNKNADANKTSGISFLNYEGNRTSVFQTYASSSSNTIYYGSADSSARGIQYHNFYVNTDQDATTGHALALRINSTGQVGICTQSIPSDAAVHIGLSGAREYLRLDADAGNNNAYIELQADDNRRKAIIFKSGGTRRACLGVGDNDEGNATKLFLSANDSLGGNNAHLIIESGGQIGVKHQTPSTQYFNTLVVGDDSVGDKGITIRTTSNAKGVLAFSDTDTADANRYDGWIGYIHRDQRMVFNTGGANHAMSIDSSRNVGIGLTNPQSNSNLHIKAATVTQLRLEATNNTSYSLLKFIEGDHDGTKDKYIIGYNDSHSAQADQFSIKNQVGDITFMAGGVETSDEKVRILSTGNVGIGITNPEALLHLKAANPQLTVMDTDTTEGNTSALIRLANASASGQTSHYFDIKKEGTDFVIKDGQIGVGVEERFRIDSAGRVAIGTATEGNSTADDLTIATSAHTGMTIRSGTSHEGNIFFSDGTSGAAEYQGIIRFDHSEDALKFNTTGSVRLTIDSDGKATFTEEIATPQDYPNYRPTVDWNFATVKKLDSRITYQRTGPASYIDELGKVVLVGANTPRFDHDSITRESKGLLIEPSRTNLIPWSFDNGVWPAGSGGATLTRNAGIAPDGTNTATKILAANNDIDINPQFGPASVGGTGQISISGGTTYTLSMWAKASTTAQVGNNFKVRWKRVQGDNVFSETTFALTADWRRYSTTATTAANNSTVACFCGGVSGSEALVWGVQFEAGAFATSLISTDGSSATRGEDVVLIDGTEFTDFFNPIEGTSVVHTHMPNSSGNSGLPAYSFLNSSVSAVTLGLSRDSNASPAYHYYNDGSNSGFTRASANNQNMYKGAMSFKTSDFDSYVNGSANTNTTTFTMPTIDNLRIGGTGGANQLSGHVARFMYYPVKLSNSQLITLTS